MHGRDRRLAGVRDGNATLAAISPALVFFVWTSTLGTSDWRVLLTVGFCVTAGAFLLAQNVAVLDRRRHWLVSQQAARPRWLAPAALLGGAAVLVALVVAPAIPGAGSDPLLDVANAGRDDSAGHSYRPSLAPFVDIGAKLGNVNDEELFTVRASQPEYWRIAALDQYTGAGGGQWTLSARGRRQRAGRPAERPARWLRAALRDRAAGRTVAARGVQARRHQPRRHPGGALLRHHRHRRRRREPPALPGRVRPAGGRRHRIRRASSSRP